MKRKKREKRADCSEDERRDFQIVMPLCLFGCDYMYEQRYLCVRDGKITKGTLPKNLTDKEKSFIENMVGKFIDTEWLKGSESYFK